jgi:serine/threonine protein phosphatase PrpC
LSVASSPYGQGLVLLQGSRSDIGCRRETNEDAVGFLPAGEDGRPPLLVVADGVGGNAAGEVASRVAVDTLVAAFAARGADGDPAAALRVAIRAANDEIVRQALADESRAGMATTCTAAVPGPGRLVVGHVGDCRAYRIGRAGVELLTRDHTLAEEYARRGSALPPEQGALAHVLTRWLGTDLELAMDILEGPPLEAEEALLLCSDGLNKVVADGEIGGTATLADPEAACRRLVELALERGAPDNVTVQIARVASA